MRRALRAVEHLWTAFPLIGVVVLFAVLGYVLYQGHSARVYAATAAKFGKDNKDLIEQVKNQDAATIKAKDDVIAEKDRQLTEKDTAIVGQTSIIGQLYNDAVALQQQVTSLGGKPKSIPVTLPPARPMVSSTPLPAGVAPAPMQTVRPPVAPVDVDCPGIQVAPLNLIQVCIPP